MQKRILIVTDNLLNQINGVVTTFTNLEKQAIANNYKVSYIEPSMFFHVSAPGYPEVKLSLVFNIGKKIKDINPDYIHIATEGPIGLAARNYCKRKGYKYNTSYHTKFPEFIKKIYSIPESLTYMYVRWFHKDSAKVLTTTNTMVNELKSHNFTSDIISWTRGVDREHLQPSVDKQDNERIVLLYAGRVSKEKSLDTLCALSWYTDKYDVQIVGDGPDMKRLKALYPRVTFVGYKSGTELANYYINADVFCFPSKTDTFGIVMIEAMSLGCPVAAHHVPGPIDVIEEGINGSMNDDLELAIEECLKLDRHDVYLSSFKWTWENCWEIFKRCLVEK